MPEDTLSFQHFHRDALLRLDLLSRADVEYPTTGTDHVTHDAALILVELYRSALKRVLSQLNYDAITPDVTFRGGLAALDTVERFRHLLENLLESVKRGGSLQNTLSDLNVAGLIEDQTIQASIMSSFTITEKAKSAFLSTWGAGKLLNTLLTSLRKVALTLMEIVINALKALPKYVSLKPKPSVGLAGAFPTFSLQLELEADSITLNELFNVLTGRA